MSTSHARPLTDAPPRRVPVARPLVLLLCLAGCRPDPRPAGGHAAIEKDAIRTVVRANIDQIRQCYNDGLARDRTLAGRVTVRFEIDMAGAVRRARVHATTLPLWARYVDRCIVRAVRRWQFPAPEGDGDGTVVVTYPFVLEPG